MNDYISFSKVILPLLGSPNKMLCIWESKSHGIETMYGLSGPWKCWWQGLGKCQ